MCVCFLGCPLPVWKSGASVARLVDLGVQRLQRRAVVLRAQGNFGALWALREVVGVAVGVDGAAVHRRVQRADAGVGMLLVRAEGAADYILDFRVLPLLGLLLSDFPRLGLYSKEKKKKP